MRQRREHAPQERRADVRAALRAQLQHLQVRRGHGERDWCLRIHMRQPGAGKERARARVDGEKVEGAVPRALQAQRHPAFRAHEADGAPQRGRRERDGPEAVAHEHRVRPGLVQAEDSDRPPEALAWAPQEQEHAR
jgi:hypothetical protein